MKVKSICQVCKKGFIYNSYMSQGKFCSLHCSGKSKQKYQDIKRVCKQCSKRFIWTVLKQGATTSGLFCSHKCWIQFKRENANDYRIKAFALLSNECFYCEKKDRNTLQVHHIDKDSFNNDIENLRIVCTTCHKKQHSDSIKLRLNKFKEGQILRGVRLILDGLRVNLKDQNFVGTPQRVLRSYYELFEGVGAEKEIDELFHSAFPSNYKGIVLERDIKTSSMCPHHLLPIEYSVDIGYISERGKMLGLSKLSRLVKLLAHRLVLQETFTQDVVNNLTQFLHADGAIAVVKGKHMCMSIRGVNMPSVLTITSAITGVFRDVKKGARQEFLQLINSHN